MISSIWEPFISITLSLKTFVSSPTKQKRAGHNPAKSQVHDPARALGLHLIHQGRRQYGILALRGPWLDLATLIEFDIMQI